MIKIILSILFLSFVLYCHSGVRVGKVTDVLSKLRGDVYHIKGDYRAWRANGQTLDRP